jgi:hypothetical protein
VPQARRRCTRLAACGNIIATNALGVIVHDTTVGGNVIQHRGGGGFTCDPQGVFALLGPPAYTAYAEIVLNHIHGNLNCRRNSMVWDSGDLTDNLFPRDPQPNTVDGKRRGQCVLSSPTTEGGPLGPGPF